MQGLEGVGWLGIKDFSLRSGYESPAFDNEVLVHGCHVHKCKCLQGRTCCWVLFIFSQMTGLS